MWIWLRRWRLSVSGDCPLVRSSSVSLLYLLYRRSFPGGAEEYFLIEENKKHEFGCYGIIYVTYIYKETYLEQWELTSDASYQVGRIYQNLAPPPLSVTRDTTGMRMNGALPPSHPVSFHSAQRYLSLPTVRSYS